MVTLLLLHHVQGLTPGVRALADRLRSGGHDVVTPDLFSGQTFETIDEGFAFLTSSGIDTDARADAAAEALPPDIAYGGISYGVMASQRLAQTRRGAVASIMIDACAPISDDFAFGPWPDGVPAQIHGKDADDFFIGDGDVKAAEEIVATVPGSDLYLYPGSEHLFCDSSLPAFDAASTDLMVERILALLERGA